MDIGNVLQRSVFACVNGCRYFKSLSRINHKRYNRTTDVVLSDLKTQGIDTLVFDFDGVLSAHGETEPQTDCHKILENSLSIFGSQQVFILTNKPLPAREAYFKTHWPSMQFIIAKRKKPYPDGLQEIIQRSKTPANRVALIDDRLLTGGLAACLAGTKMVFINKPYQNFKKRFWAECFFQGLRAFEKLIFFA